MTVVTTARKMMNRRNRVRRARMRQLRVFVFATLALGFASAALAQSYPAKPIKIVIPFPPGNTMDIMTRLAGPKMTERMGQQIIVENRPGASGMLGLEFVARAAPDGYTIAAGQVQAAIDGITGLTPHVRSGRLRLLAITNRTRVPLWPDTPAAAETVGGYESGGWFGYVAPAGTPRAIILKLNEEINRAMKVPDVSDKLVTAGLIVVAESPEYFGEVIRGDYAKYEKLVRDIGFQPQ